LSPRLGLSLEAGSSGIFSASGGLHYQFPADFSGLLSDIIAANPNMNADKVPLDEARLQRCWQGVLGYERQLGDTHLLSVETWFKWYDREYPFERPGSRRYGKWVKDRYKWLLDKPTGKKRGYGFELSFQKKSMTTFTIHSIIRFSMLKTDTPIKSGTSTTTASETLSA